MFNNRKEIILHSSIFIFISFYILSSSANILLFHFFIDINLAKIGMLVVFVGLIPYTYKDILKRWTEQKIMIIFIFFWALYLLLNSYFSLYPIISIKFILRIIGCWLIAFQFSILLTNQDGKYHNTILVSLLFTFFIITLIWNLHIRAPETLAWFKQRMPHRMDSRLTGLYINPNELGYALVIHSFLLSWFIKEKTYFLLLILPLAFWGVYLSGSRNSLLALLIVSIFGLFISFWKFFKYHQFKKINIGLFIIIIILCSSFLIYHFIPPRVKATLNQFTNQIILSEPSETVQRIYSKLGVRKKIFEYSIETWKNNKWIGTGIGSFYHYQNITHGLSNSHNLLLSILLEQGIIGLGFVFIFFIIISYYMKNLIGSIMLIILPLTLMFDDLSWSYIFPTYLSILLGICLFYSLINENHFKSIHNS